MNSNFNSSIARFYQLELPKKGDIVMVKVKDKNEFGYNVLLLEYKNIEGFVNLSELSKRSRSRKKNIIKKDDVLPLCVSNVDVDKKLIDLSKRYLTNEDSTNAIFKFGFTNKIHRIAVELHKLFNNHKNGIINPDDVMDSTIWKFFSKYSNIGPEEQLNIILSDPRKIICDDKFDKDFVNKFCDNIKSRLIREDCILQTKVKVLVLDHKGVDILKQIFDINLDDKCKDYKLKIEFHSPPIYKINIEGPNEIVAESILNDILNNIKNKVKEYKVIFNIENEISIIKKSKVDIKLFSKYDLDKIIL